MIRNRESCFHGCLEQSVCPKIGSKISGVAIGIFLYDIRFPGRKSERAAVSFPKLKDGLIIPMLHAGIRNLTECKMECDGEADGDYKPFHKRNVLCKVITIL